ncbi:MAG: hypothetical protein ACFB2X_23410 [Rivularia sp. (in: cyanobacteria)]
MAIELTATKIIELAFGGIIQGAVGKVTEMGVGELVKRLQDKIRRKFQGNPDATKAIKAVEKGSEADLPEAARYLNAFMTLEPAFAQEVRILAQQINQSKHEETTTMNQNNLDNAKGYQVSANEIEHIGDVINPG